MICKPPSLKNCSQGTKVKDKDPSSRAGDMTESSTSDHGSQHSDDPYYDEDADNDDERPSVGFGKVKFRNYGMTLGDHPACHYGPPVQLGWNYESIRSIQLDEYEETRPPRRRMHQMVLNNARRTTILNKNGTTPDEIDQAVKGVNKVKRQRGITRALLPYAKVEEAAESAGRKLGRMSGRK